MLQHHRISRLVAVAAATLLGAAGIGLAAPSSSAAAASTLEVGVGRADITPPTGHYFMGWVESSAVGTGVNTRLYARTIVLKQGTKKYALIAEDANGIPGGMLLDAIKQVSDLGFTPQNVLDSASHTHAQASGYYNYGTYNTVFMTASSVQDLTSQNVSGALDPALYAFMVRQLALSIRRADGDLGPGSLGWGSTRLSGLTQNRSLEAHLANFGIDDAFNTGKVSEDPGGYDDTIDPDVQLLRVDKMLGGKDYPVGAWETFADHGTVNKATWLYYNADHHAAADRVVEDTLRSEGKVPAGQDVISAYGNGDEGDQTAGIAHSGPADAEYVGDAEAKAFLTAWRAAGAAMTTTPALASRWTQTSMRSQPTSGGGTTADDPVPGLPLFTGSEEGRGPLYELDGVPFEGDRLPADNPADPAQGRKIQVRTALPDSIAVGAGQAVSAPTAVPLLLLQIGDRAIASIPGEMTVTMGQRLRAAVLPTVAGLGVKHVVIAGLANEYLSYFTTPDEFEAQHYEGGSTMYGKYAAYHLLDVLVDLGKRLAAGQPDPEPDPTDLINGVTAADTPPTGTGATSATATTQPQQTQRLNQATFTWQGGAGGLDLPVDTAASPDHAFITVRRQTGTSWTKVTDDLGLQIYWGVDSNGVYTAHWEIPRDAVLGSYDLVVTANHYTLTSEPFTVVPSTRLVVSSPAAGTVHVGYPAAVYNSDITYRPADISGGIVNGVKISGATAPGSVVAAGAASDPYGNCNGDAYGTSGSVSTCPSNVVGTSTTATGAPADPTASGPAGTVSVTVGGKKSSSSSLAVTGLPAGLALLALGCASVGISLLRRPRRGRGGA